MKKRNVISFIAVVSVLIIILFRVNTSKRVTAEFIPAKKQLAFTTILANGRVAGSKVTPLSFLRSGVVDNILVSERQQVQPGDTLIKLDNREELNAVEQRKNAVRIASLNLERLSVVDEEQAKESNVQADANAGLQKDKVARLETLFKEGSVSKEMVEQARKEYSIAISEQRKTGNTLDQSISAQKELFKSQVLQAKVQLRDAEINLSRTVLRAPEAGQVIKIDARKGQLVLPGTTAIFFLPADTILHVEVQVDESDIGKIKSGQNAVVTPAGSTKRYDASVQNIVPLVDASRGTATVNISVTGADDAFLPDLSVSAQIIIDTTDAVFVVPQIYIQNGSGTNSFVYVNRNRKAVKTDVVISDAGGGMFKITKGLSDGDTLLLAPSLKNGTSVRLKDVK